jgi:hypothetical protein
VQAQQAVQPRYDVRYRVPKPIPPPDATAPKLLARNSILKEDGEVLWRPSMPSSPAFEKARIAAEAAVRVAVKEFKANGKATIQSVAEAKSQLFAYGQPVLKEVAKSKVDEAKKLLGFFMSLEHVLDGLAED